MSIQPLNDRMPLVNPDGTPTQFFLRQLQDRGITIDGKITAEQAAKIAQGLIDDWAAARDINTIAPILGGGNLSTDLTISHDVSGVTPGTYGDATNSPQITVDDEGHVTNVTNVPISGGGGGGGGRTLITTFTAAGGETGFTFSSIPSSYEDLLLVFYCRGTAAAGDIQIDLQYNSSATGYSWQQLFNTSSASSSSDTKLRQFQCAAASAPSGVFSAGELRIFKYTSTIAHKVNTMLVNNSTGSIPRILTGAGRWANTAAITTITGIVPSGGLVAGSEIRLYGLT